MSMEQVQEEKLSLQKALLHFEGIHGRPVGDTHTHIYIYIYLFILHSFVFLIIFYYWFYYYYKLLSSSVSLL